MTFLVLSYVQAMQSARASLDRTTGIAVRRADKLLADADRILTRITSDTELTASPTTIRLLARAEYIDPRFREVGLIDQDGFLVATNFGPVDPPVAIPAEQRADPQLRRLQVLGVFETALMRERSIVLALPIQGKGELNLLVDPVILVDVLEEIERDPDGFVALTTAQGEVLARIGPAPVRDGSLVLADAAPGLQVTRSTGQGLITVVAQATIGWVLRQWRDDLRVVAPIAIVCNGFLAALVLGNFRRHTGLDHDLRLGLNRGEFSVHYQPIVELGTGRCVGVEALLRWRHPEHGMVSPDVFIPIAEKTDALPALTDWLLERIAADMPALLTLGDGLLLAVNIGPSQLAGGAGSQLMKSIADCGIDQNRLILEITETSLLNSHGLGYRVAMAQLRSWGASFALDDFGIGSSSFENIIEAHVKYLKIDKSFVRSIGRDPRRETVLDGLIDLAHKLDLEVIAEGVETPDERAYLLDRGVRYGQGWLFSAAVAVADLRSFPSATTVPAA